MDASSAGDCLVNDHVNIYDGNSNASPSLGTFCSDVAPPTTYSTLHHLHIEVYVVALASFCSLVP